MNLRELRIRFSQCLAALVLKAPELGVEVAVGEVLRPPRLAKLYAAEGKGVANSVHIHGLAADLAAYREGHYLTKSEDYKALGEYWKTLHPLARWGGDFETLKDGNHFSFEYQGVK